MNITGDVSRSCPDRALERLHHAGQALNNSMDAIAQRMFGNLQMSAELERDLAIRPGRVADLNGAVQAAQQDGALNRELFAQAEERLDAVAASQGEEMQASGVLLEREEQRMSMWGRVISGQHLTIAIIIVVLALLLI